GGQQLVAFRDEMQPGDLIVAPARQLGLVCIAVVTGPYEWSIHPIAGDHHHSRAVDWIGQLELSEVPGDIDRVLRSRWTLTRVREPAATWLLECAQETRSRSTVSNDGQTAHRMPTDARLDAAWDTPPGARLTRDERMRRYGGAKYGGIQPSRVTPNVFL